MKSLKWVKVDPADYDLDGITNSVERAVSLELEVGL
jgi:hypothetical protein